MTRIAIRVGERPDGGASAPVWLHQIADYGNVKVTYRWPLGDWSLSWDQEAYRGANLSALEQGRVVEAWHAGTRIWGGTLDAVSDDGTYSASGFCRQAESCYALDGNGKATADADLAVFVASNFGRKAFNVGSLSPFNSLAQQLPLPEAPQKLGALLDQLCALNERRWYVTSDRAIYVGVDNLTPKFFVNSTDTLGISSETQATDLLVGHFDSVASYVVTAVGAAGASVRIEKLVDATGLGPITVAAAQALGRQVLAEAGPVAAFTSSIVVTHGEVTNAGGARVGLSAIRAGATYRINGMTDPRNGALATDVLMAESVWDEEAGEVQLTPMGADRDDLSATIEGLGMSLEAA